ncbi:hypothetical protein HBZ99_004078 [Salmonella enterica subsp. enterica]|nr:hypothetical protein [Salmonella enterica]EEP4266232.1 hypothetical protein [Salmonella enterica subsp. enterica serovar Oranienburg]HBM0024000.1 hypothetical protein [Salmonella enterica subsp. enterica serovar Muenchen]EDY5957126.1 hypothetical protein [Salmonella enterica]EEP8813677.1 hypothetical protein [Salmonella enterica subsp. enterica serovar Oranienburg]
MAHYILMNIQSLEYIRESADLSENGYDEVLLKFVCETPLTELDTCEMIYRYFGDVFLMRMTTISLSVKATCRKWAVL